MHLGEQRAKETETGKICFLNNMPIESMKCDVINLNFRNMKNSY